MGILVAKRYPTNLVAGLADHTYVECHTGLKGWSCWGGKINGTTLRVAQGSTLRANAIAEPDEKAAIRCYAINGVCHQSANRILFPAKVTVRGARGYKVSEAMYGMYGRYRDLFGACLAPFNQHHNVVGDSPECQYAPAAQPAVVPEANVDPEKSYIDAVIAIYNLFGAFEPARTDDGHAMELQVRLFMNMVSYELGGNLERGVLQKLEGIRADEEKVRMEIERAFIRGEMRLTKFVDELNQLTVNFQASVAEVLAPEDYSALLGLDPKDRVILVSLEAARQSYPDRD